MRAQEDSGIQEELKTSGINKEMFYTEKEIAAISVAARMLWLVGTAKIKCLHVCKFLLMMLLNMEGSNKKLKCWL
jgi:hypothetical protein